MIPTEEEYKKAKKITDVYENEVRRLEKLKIKAFEKDLQEYFNNNLIDGEFKLKKFELDDNYGWIVPIDPYMEEYYEGSNDEDIERLCEKHEVYFRMASYCYHK